ncbi:MAG: sulfatase-like hydrolase/transferase [Verrucomicrobia bacterium]|nr:sulfatase-like hydrolase/transferase [Verrucomicrobiota bacterium]
MAGLALAVVGAVLGCTDTLSAADAPTRARKPNILLIYSDDHGWADLGAQGVDKDIRTPNLDQLARDGVRFARGYVSAPQCVPSRAGVLTGRYQQKFGVEDNGKGPLPLAELTIAERLKPAGYVSGQVGKWHLDIGGKQGGKADKSSAMHLPHAQGFDEYWCGSLRQYHASHDLKGQPLADPPKLVTDARFRVVVQTDAALSFLDRRAARPEQPWFLYLAWFAPHVPLDSPEPWFSQTPAHLPKERRQALSMIAAMDAGLGSIRAKLKAMGAEQDTLIVFIGDNGAPLKQGAWNGSLNLPLVGEKGMLADGGVRTPFLAAWPGKIPSGQVYPHPVSALDVAATAVALAGQAHDEKLDGVNLMPFLTGANKSAPHDALFWRWRSQAAVLEFPWKLIQLGTNETYLFNVTHPDGETKNLLLQNPAVAARLETKLKKWSATLQPPGPPERSNEQDNMFFAAHVDKTIEHATRRRVEVTKGAPVGSVQGWLCRNGSLAMKDGALVITPDAAAKAAPFLAHTGLEIPGPVTVTLRVRAGQGGRSAIAWRTQEQRDFTAENTADFDWPASTDWQEVKATLPTKGRVIHLRISAARGSTALEVQSIELRGRDSEPKVWQFNPTK